MFFYLSECLDFFGPSGLFNRGEIIYFPGFRFRSKFQGFQGWRVIHFAALYIWGGLHLDVLRGCYFQKPRRIQSFIFQGQPSRSEFLTIHCKWTSLSSAFPSGCPRCRLASPLLPIRLPFFWLWILEWVEMGGMCISEAQTHPLLFSRYEGLYKRRIWNPALMCNGQSILTKYNTLQYNTPPALISGWIFQGSQGAWQYIWRVFKFWEGSAFGSIWWDLFQKSRHSIQHLYILYIISYYIVLFFFLFFSFLSLLFIPEGTTYFLFFPVWAVRWPHRPFSRTPWTPSSRLLFKVGDPLEEGGGQIRVSPKYFWSFKMPFEWKKSTTTVLFKHWPLSL